MIQKKNLLGVSALAAGIIAVCSAADPSWWTTAGVSGTSSNKSPANLGQVKNMAAFFHAELEDLLPGGAGFGLDEAFPSPPNPTTATWRNEQLKMANIGQLKHVAAFYYDRLNSLAPEWVTQQMVDNGLASNWVHTVPWDPDTPVDKNYAATTLGQVKMVFSLRVNEDADDDDIPDLVEYILYRSTGGNGSTTDYDGDGLYDRDEWITHGTSPFSNDTDFDGINDGEEITNGSDPTIANVTSNGMAISPAVVLTPLID